jgi:hypothetical protein
MGTVLAIVAGIFTIALGFAAGWSIASIVLAMKMSDRFDVLNDDENK